MKRKLIAREVFLLNETYAEGKVKIRDRSKENEKGNPKR